MARPSVLRHLLSNVLSGFLLSAGFWTGYGDFGAGLCWLGMVLLIVSSLGARPRVAALGGILSGAVFYAITLRWIYTVMRVHGGLPAVSAAGVLALIVAAGSLFFAAFTLGVAWIARPSVARACLAAPLLWVVLEFVRTHLPAIAFPWALLGYATGRSLVLLQLTSVTGIYGLSFLITAYCAFVAWSVERLEQQRLGGKFSLAPTFLLLIVTPLLPAAARIGEGFVPHDHGQHSVHLVQTNFPQSPSYPADWMERHAADLDELDALSIGATAQKPGLIVWPEVPAPFSLQDARFAARAERIARASRDGFLVGVVDWKPGAHGGHAPYNSAALLDPAGRRVFLYDKIHLVPFGEYVPLRRWLTFAAKLTVEVGEFQTGSEPKVGQLPGTSERFGVFICFEAVFPNEVRQFAANGANVLVNISNDGWFGRSAAPEQHVMMARVRAVENRRWLLRATNNGYTVVVDPYGRYTARMEPDKRGVLSADYGFRNDLTLYTRWGDWLAWLCVVGTAGMLIGGAVTSRRPKVKSRTLETKNFRH